ncbi:MAG: alpha/beta hydrolase [Ornithinimicrobium sp.]|uniref:alpha/beta fold hydrolase n=1 Tax=Ornithinimicrobium sp. TaxID=1977084 RepID=UPI0026DF2053|nr:alpha/beta hydrolase [Ornithinimicrobium sp.]MDO5740336.1 alpha/beta hydrolase [Ornithinimicrobium sp.]
MPDHRTRSFERDGATITYDVRGDLDGAVPLLLLGSPMDAGGFTALAAEITDRPTITCDPRGTGRSTRHDDPAGELTPLDHAADLSLLAAELGVEQVDVFASSGGAVNALAWVAQHPGQVRTLVAHEPPTPTLLPDREPLLAAVKDIASTYQERGFGAAMGKFIALVGYEGELPSGFTLPEIDPAQFGLPAHDDGTGSDPLLRQNLRGLTDHPLAVEALRRAPTRIVLARGESSGQQMAARSAQAVAEVLGRDLVTMPGDHTGFTPGEWGMGGDPKAFAIALLDLL